MHTVGYYIETQNYQHTTTFHTVEFTMSHKSNTVIQVC